MANFFVPLEVARTLILIMGSVSLILSDSPIVKTTSKNLYVSSIALLVVLSFIQVISWGRTTIPLVKGQLSKIISHSTSINGGKSAVLPIIECVILVGLAVFTTNSLFGLPELKGEIAANLLTFINVTRVSLVLAYMAILEHIILFLYNLVAAYWAAMAPLSDRLYTEASEAADEKGFDMEFSQSQDRAASGYATTASAGIHYDDTNWLLDGATPTEKMSECSAFGNDLASMVDKERL